MNLSGRAAIHLVRKFGVPASDLIVVHDDVDLPLGRLRLKRGGGAAGQKGVVSIADSLRTQDFLRVRIGVSRPAERDQMIDYVLDRFTPEERERLAAVLSRAVDAVMTLVKDGLDTAMTEYNRAPDD
jgi:PTH1 family peptidyl-tRNA hydrolase